MNKEKIKAFMFDLDATLINVDCVMSDKVAYALKKLKENGYITILSSGRPLDDIYCAINKYIDIDVFDYYYGSNGIEFYTSKTDKTELLGSLPIEAINKIASIFTGDYYYLCFYDFSNGRYVCCNKEIDNKAVQDRLINRNFIIKTIDFKKDITHPVPKMVCFHEGSAYDRINEFISTLNDDEFDSYSSGSMVTEIVPKNVSNGKGSEHFSKLSGIKKDEIMSFGDSPNDLEMLNNTCGVLMGNAPEALKKDFTEIAKSVDDDGVYYYLLENGFIN